MPLKIRRNDQVEVIAGKDKGMRGRVLRVLADRHRVLVEQVGMIKKHVKANAQQNSNGGIIQQESPIHLSNVMLVDAAGKRTRFGAQIEDGRKVRVSKVSGSAILDRK